MQINQWQKKYMYQSESHSHWERGVVSVSMGLCVQLGLLLCSCSIFPDAGDYSFDTKTSIAPQVAQKPSNYFDTSGKEVSSS